MHQLKTKHHIQLLSNHLSQMPSGKTDAEWIQKTVMLINDANGPNDRNANALKLLLVNLEQQQALNPEYGKKELTEAICAAIAEVNRLGAYTPPTASNIPSQPALNWAQVLTHPVYIGSVIIAFLLGALIF